MNRYILDRALCKIIDDIVVDKNAMTVEDLPDYDGWIIKRLKKKIHSCHRVNNYFYSIPSCSRIVAFRGISGAMTFLMDLSGRKITPFFHSIYATEIKGKKVLVGLTGMESCFINRYTGEKIKIEETIDCPNGLKIYSVYEILSLGYILSMYEDV